MALLLAGISQTLYKYYRAHAHSSHEVILNLEGEGIISVGDMDYPFYPGSIHVIPKGAYHKKALRAV